MVWALSGGAIPLAIGVLQILALDIGTDLLPALALGAEPPNPHTMHGAARTGRLIDGQVLRRVFGVLGPAEAMITMLAFLGCCSPAGGRSATHPHPSCSPRPRGVAFMAIVLGQLANAFACRSETRWLGRVGFIGNPLLLWAVLFELGTLAAFLLMPPLPGLLGGTLPNALGWGMATLAIPAVWLADTVYKGLRASGHQVDG